MARYISFTHASMTIGQLTKLTKRHRCVTSHGIVMNGDFFKCTPSALGIQTSQFQLFKLASFNNATESVAHTKKTRILVHHSE